MRKIIGGKNAQFHSPSYMYLYLKEKIHFAKRQFCRVYLLETPIPAQIPECREPAIPMDIEIVEVSENEREKKPRADTAYKEVFRLFGKYPKNWDMNRTQIAAAKNLLEEQGITTIGKILRWYANHKHDPYCPQITSPYDLDSKLPKLEAYRDRL